MNRREIALVGQVNVGVEMTHAGRVDRKPMGPGLDVARSASYLADRLTSGLIVGANLDGEELVKQVIKKLPDVEVVAVRSASHTRFTKQAGEWLGADRRKCEPPVINGDKSLLALHPIATSARDGVVFVGPFPSTEFGWIQAVVTLAKNVNAKVVARVDLSAIAVDHARSLELARSVDVVVVTRQEITALTGKISSVEGILSLREQHAIKGSIIVIEGENGLIGHDVGAGWISQRAYAVEANQHHGVRDVICGTLIAAISQRIPLKEGCKLAMAAAAMERAGMPRERGWKSLGKFAAETATIPPRGIERVLLPSVVANEPVTLPDKHAAAAPVSRIDRRLIARRSFVTAMIVAILVLFMLMAQGCGATVPDGVNYYA